MNILRQFVAALRFIAKWLVRFLVARIEARYGPLYIRQDDEM